jgi:hypothetical protein
MYRYNPPFVCADLDEFWNYNSEHQANILHLKTALETKYGSVLYPKLKWGIPMYCMSVKGKDKPICHFIYLRQNKTKKLLFHFGFFQGYKMYDYHNLFELTKMTQVRGIPITDLSDQLIDQILGYIDQAIELRHT